MKYARRLLGDAGVYMVDVDKGNCEVAWVRRQEGYGGEADVRYCEHGQ